jgi:hypothetical protein
MTGRSKVKTQIKGKPWSSKLGVGCEAEHLTSNKTLLSRIHKNAQPVEEEEEEEEGVEGEEEEEEEEELI